MGSPPTYFRLPDIVPGKEWPFLCPPHPLQARANTESLQWVKSFGIHDDRALQKFARYRCDVLVAWSYRHASAAHYRLCMDFMHVFWVIDDRTDKLPRNKVEKEVTDIKIALKDPDGAPPADESILGKIVRSFWSSVIKNINPPPATRARWLTNFISYLDSLPEEAGDRDSGHLRGIEEHFNLRRRTGGLLPSFDFIYMPFDLPDVIADHPHIKRMTLATGDLVIIANDIYSWNVEQAGGQMQVAHNIVDVVIRTKGLNVQDAFDYVGSIYRRICAGLLDDLKNLPSFEGPYNDVLKFYVEGLVEWVQGNVEFSLASGRYFGHLAGSQQIRATGIVEVLPPKSDGKILSYWMKSYLAYFYSWKKALVADV